MDRTRLFFLMVLVGAFLAPPGYAQESEWRALPGAPFVSRHNDAYFRTPDLGWIVNGDGHVYKTSDGGQSWGDGRPVLRRDDAHFRSVGFLNDSLGWAGNVGLGEFGTTDPNILYETRDGGVTWRPMNEFTGPPPAGLCGMQVVNDSVVVAVGRVRGPSVFVKTTDRGETWISKDMSEHAAGLIDVYFTHPDSGFAVGLTNTDHDQSSAVILNTTDGGDTWETRFTSTRTGEWAWKMSFPSHRVGYVSLQRNELTPIYFLKTTDGGQTWEEKLFSNTYYFVQGIGFATETHGWIGGNSSFPTYQTTDGGETWTNAGFGSRVNRFRFLSDSLGYAVGRTVYKYEPPVTVDAEDVSPLPVAFSLDPPYPNPFTGATTLRYRLAEASAVEITVYDAAGHRVSTLLQTAQPAGTYTMEWNGTQAAGQRLADGTYFITLQAGPSRRTRTVVLLR